MGLTATLAGHRALTARVTLPKWGAWYADVTIDGETELSGAVELVIADLHLKGAVISGGPYKGKSTYTIVGGAGGWGKTLKKKSYANDAGVKTSKIIGDAAQECGEKLDASTLPSGTVGPAWARNESIATVTLNRLVPARWYVGEDGVTRIGARAKKTFGGVAVHVAVDRARGTAVVASDSIAALVPGAVVDGLESVDVQHEIDAKGNLRTKVWGDRFAGATARRLAAYRRIFDALDPDRAFRGVYEYRVVTLEGSRLNLQPVRVSTGMPDLQRVTVRPGVAGTKSTLRPGARVVVGFVDADGARPVVIAEEDQDGEGFLPIDTSIDAQTLVKLGAGIKPVASLGDLAGGIWPIATTQVKVLV